MTAITTFLDRIFIAATCVLGWAVFPLFIAVGAIALFMYALLAELFSPASGRYTPIEGHALASPAAGVRFRETLQP